VPGRSYRTKTDPGNHLALQLWRFARRHPCLELASNFPTTAKLQELGEFRFVMLVRINIRENFEFKARQKKTSTAICYPQTYEGGKIQTGLGVWNVAA